MDKISAIATKITDKLIGANVNLSIKEDSLLACAAGELDELIPEDAVSTEEAATVVNEQSDERDDPFMTEEELEEAEPEGLGDVYGHCISNIVEPMAPVVNGIVAKIKDQIIPTVNTVFDEAYRNTTDHIDCGGVQLKIVTDGSDSLLWKSLIGTLSLSKDLGFAGPEYEIVKGLNFPAKTEEEILEDITSMAGEHVEAIKAMIKEEEVSLVEYYNYTFNVGAGKVFADRKLQTMVTCLLAIRYTDNIPEGVTGGDLNEYQAVLLNLLRSNAAGIRYQVEKAETSQLDGRLVVSYPAPDSALTKGATIVVNGLLYDEWLEAGGTVDAIYGAYLTNPRINRGYDILENKDVYTRKWINFVATAQSSMNDKFESHFKRALLAAIYAHGQEVGIKLRDEGYEYINNHTAPLDTDNAYIFARMATVLCLWGDGDHLRIIESVDHIAKQIKGIELDDAIDIALVDWLVDWALSQVEISKG